MSEETQLDRIEGMLVSARRRAARRMSEKDQLDRIERMLVWVYENLDKACYHCGRAEPRPEPTEQPSDE